MLLKCCTQYFGKFGKIQQWSQDWKRSTLIPIPKKDKTKECSNHWTVVCISHTSWVMFKIIQGFGWFQFSHSVVSNSLQPREPQHARHPCPSPIPGVHPNPCPLSDAIQPFHPLSSPSSPALNLSQHQGLFKWVSSLHQVAVILEFQLQLQSFQWIFRTDLLYRFTGLICLLSKRLSRVFSNTTVKKHQFFRAQHSLWSNSHIRTWLLEKP